MWPETTYLWMTNTFFRVTSVVFVVGILLLYFNSPKATQTHSNANGQQQTNGQP